MEYELKKIFEGCKNNDINSQKELYNIFQKKMFGICLRYSKDFTDAEDIAHDGFLKIFENIKQCKTEKKLEAWMRKIMINTALMQYRKKRGYLYISSDHQYINDDLLYNDIIDNISAKELLNFIKELPPKYKMVFNLYAIDGYKHQEISKMLNISIGTSKSNLSRARMILKEKIKKLNDETKFTFKKC